MISSALLLAFLEASGFESATVTPLPGGANNRVFRVEANTGTALLKEYFRSAGDSWDRLGAEFSFSQLAWDSGIRCIPRPLASEPALGCALYELVPGRRLRPDEVDEAAVEQALGFYRLLNAAPVRAAGKSRVGAGAEACFSVAEHLDRIERRIERLAAMPVDSSVDRETASFVRDELVPRWRAARRKIENEAGGGLPQVLALEERRLSPSDFGFHNALLAPDGQLRFLDFEYAGWDDPAKTVGDFFCQVEVPVEEAFLSRFTEEAVDGLPRPEIHRRRIELLLPAYRLKWCAILLNEFLSAGRERREFATRGDAEERKRRQLDKARRRLGHPEDTGGAAWPT